jgi:hypothetical protein
MASAGWIADASLPVFAYGDEGEDDFGWGCVYRNVQTATHAWTGKHEQRLEVMAEYVGLAPPSDDLQSRWIEPHDAARLFHRWDVPHSPPFVAVPRGSFVGAEVPVHRSEKFPFHRTPLDAPRVDLESLSEIVFRHVTHHARNTAVIDDSIYGFLVLDARKDAADQEELLVGDPHRPGSGVDDAETRLRWESSKAFFGEKPWAVCLVGRAVGE